MRTLSAATDAATQLTVTQPGYLILLETDVALRLSSRGDQTWDGYSWTGGRIKKVTNIGSQSSGARTGKLEIINTDLAFSALVLNSTLADKGITIWKFYGDNPAAEDPVELFRGVVDEVRISGDVVELSLLGENTKTYYSPRKFVNAASGFNHLRPAGTRISWGGQVYVLDRAQ